MEATGEAAEPAGPTWRPLFDGKTLTGWKATRFGGEGEVHVAEEQIVLDFGYSLTGVTWTEDFPKTNYEISLEANRLQGIDFFCGLTFPVDDSHCSFIVGGWSGGVVGISSIDGQDASQNQTTTYKAFENDRWYRIRVRVTPERISAWIDDEQMVDVSIVGRRISTRVEVDLSKPLGISAYETKAGLRDIKYRLLEED